MRQTFTRAFTLGALALGATACDDSNDSLGADQPQITPKNSSVTTPLVKGLPTGVQAFSIFSSADTLPGMPRFGGSADGAGLLKNADGTFTLITNHEDNFAVSRMTLDKEFTPVALDYLVSSQAGRWRLCSATMATPEEHGFGPLYITNGESGIDSQIHGINPRGAAFTASDDASLLPALGRWSSEQALPLPKTAFSTKTVILIGDDDSGTNGGQLAMYVGTSIGDLRNGSLYVLARKDNNIRERDMVVGSTYDVEFRQVPNTAGTTAQQEEAAGLAASMMQFGRVEDIDYRKGTGEGREIYFNVTGQNNTGVNANYGRTKYGRTYRLVLDPASPLKGTLSVVLDGDDRAGPARQFQNPDNIYVGSNYAYIQEDPNSYGDETHDAYIYQYNLTTKEVKVVMELDHRRSVPTDAAQFLSATSTLGSWEYGSMTDVSAQTGIRDAFLIQLQPHSWREARFLRIAGAHPNVALNTTENQGSQVILVTGLPR
jgi:hypothetical protein